MKDINRSIGKLVLVGFCLWLVACSSEDESAVVESENLLLFTPEELAESKVRYKQMMAKENKARHEKMVALKQSIFTASDEVLKKILSDCRHLVKEYVDSRNKGPFSNYMIDQYSAGTYQYHAGRNALMTDEQRIEDLRKSKDYISFNTKYAMLSAYDSFNGPQKTVDKYECKIEEGPKVGRVSISY